MGFVKKLGRESMVFIGDICSPAIVYLCVDLFLCCNGRSRFVWLHGSYFIFSNSQFLVQIFFFNFIKKRFTDISTPFFLAFIMPTYTALKFTLKNHLR